MTTEKLKYNKILRIGVILMIIAIITLITLSMTFAKYTSQSSGSDNARVARWGLNSNIPTDLNLFDASYIGTGSKTIIDASDASNVIAPGTSKSDNVTLATFEGNQAPEVMYHFEPSVDIVDGYVQGSNSLTAQLDSLTGWHWTLGKNGESATEYKTIADFKAAVVALQEKDIDPNTLPSISTIQLGWKWDYEINNDANDTNLGNLIAQGNLSGLKVTLNLNAYQCQGCIPTYKPIVTQVDGTSVTFLPAYSGNDPGCKFYTKSEDTYTEITGITNMASLSSAISTAGAANVYTDATGKTFYGTIERSWNNTFKSDTTSGVVSAGLNSNFVEALNTAGVKTVYFANNTDTTATSTGNWNYSSNDYPTLNGVKYGTSYTTLNPTEFYGAYKNLLCGRAYYAWLSRARSSSDGYMWNVARSTEWGGRPRTESNAVVLSKAF